MYPLKFGAEYKETVWGGRKIATFLGKDDLPDKIGESWELYDGSVVLGGEHDGLALGELMSRFGPDLLGSEVWQRFEGQFPLLYKFIDAADKLSVQVHPDDAGARRIGKTFGKEEMWYIMDAPDAGSLICGLAEGCDAASLEEAIAAGHLADKLVRVSAGPGDFLYIPAGTVHALMPGYFVAEIQQNSDLTFRLYDWDRKDANGVGRTLHIREAIEAINYERPLSPPFEAKDYTREDALICTGPSIAGFFNDHVRLGGRMDITTDRRGFSTVMVLSGTGALIFDGGEEPLEPGDTVLLPASLGQCRAEGDLTFLHTYYIRKGQG